MKLDIDASAVRELAADLTAIPGRLPEQAQAVMQRGALEIKRAWGADLGASSLAATKAAGRSIRYDTKSASASHIEVEIGPEKPSGAFANIAIWGTSRGGGTHADPSVFLEREAPSIEDHLGRIVEDLL